VRVPEQILTPSRLLNRFRHLFHELGKFGVVGGVTYVIDTGLFKLGLEAGIAPLLAKTGAAAVATTLAFLGNRFWTWRHRPRSGLRREYSLYFFFNVIGLGIGLACLAVSHYALGSVWPIFRTQNADLLSANAIGMALGTTFRFWSYRQIVFRTRSVTEDETPPEPK
jgi:putative flippase GtrA